jgi:hypothetical protein
LAQPKLQCANEVCHAPDTQSSWPTRIPWRICDHHVYIRNPTSCVPGNTYAETSDTLQQTRIVDMAPRNTAWETTTQLEQLWGTN